MPTYAEVLAALSRADVRFIVVGGWAVAYAGFERLTLDLNLLVDREPANLRTLLDVLTRLGDGAAAELAPEDFPLEEGAVRIAETLVFDLFVLMSGQTYADLLPQTALHDVDREPVRFLNADGLIALKSESLRPKDRLDAEALRAVQCGEAL